MSGADTFQPGAQLGRYALVRPIASGGMATVWAARLMGTRGFQKLVAVKIMHPSLREEPDAERMFLAEARLASRIRHANVAEVLDLGEESGALYLVMEWVHGATLSAVLTAAQRGRPMPASVAVRIARHIAAGLHAAHTLTDEAGNPIGLVHRDVTPQNVLVGFNGVTKVVDFGVAKVTSEAGSETRFGQVKGKVAYMAPEQLRAEPLDPRVDVFAAGILLYMMTTGTHPFRRPGDTRDAVHAILAEEPPQSPSELVRDCSPRLQAAILRALEKDRSRRFETAEHLEAALARVFPPSVKEGDTVREYVRALLPGAYQEGIDLAKAALNPFEPLVASSSFSDLAKAKPPSHSTLRAVAVSTGPDEERSRGATLVPPVPGSEPAFADPAATLRRPRRPGPLVAGVIGVVAAASVGLLLWWPATSVTGGGGSAASSPVPALESGPGVPHVPISRPAAAPAVVPPLEETPAVAAPASTTTAAAGQGTAVPAQVGPQKPRPKAAKLGSTRGSAKAKAEGLKDPYE